MDEWEELNQDFKALEQVSKKYQDTIEEVNTLGKQCEKQLQHQNYLLRILEKKSQFKKFSNELEKRKAKLTDIKNTLPKEGSLYLKVILGNVNVAIQNKEDKYRYKKEYETFKLILNIVSLTIALHNIIFGYRIVEILYMFLLVWYHCTLTIRESILRANGSKIRGWWRLHHAISLFASGVLIVWPESASWEQFRKPFMLFNAYLSFLQFLQYKYQSGSLYRLKALGEKSNMDVTIFGFHSWMWRGLKFMLPFLFAGYLFELYLAWTLYELRDVPRTKLHVNLLALSFFVLAFGNIITTLRTILDKIKVNIKVSVE